MPNFFFIKPYITLFIYIYHSILYIKFTFTHYFIYKSIVFE